MSPRPTGSASSCLLKFVNVSLLICELFWFLEVQHDEQQLIPVHPSRRRHYHGVDRCPTGFIYSPTTSTCYLLRSQQVTWDAAHRHCRRLGAQLLTIQSSTEQRQLADLARTNSGRWTRCYTYHTRILAI